MVYSYAVWTIKTYKFVFDYTLTFLADFYSLFQWREITLGTDDGQK